MNRRKMMTSAAAVITSVSAFKSKAAVSETRMTQSSPVPPVARKIPKRIEQLGRVRVDDYAWMKDDNWQKVLRDPTLIKPEVKEHLSAENAYVKAMLASTEALQAAMFEEMKGRIKEDDASVPAPDGPWEYYSRFNIGGQHPIFCRRPRGRTDGEEILLDCDALAKGKAYSQVSAADHSPDHQLFAYAEDAQGSEVHHIYVKDLTTGEVLKEPVESSTGDFAWSPDSQWLFWTHRDDNGRSDKIYRRPARGGLKDDVLVYDEPDDGFFVSVGTTGSDAFIVISAGDHETSETLLIPASDPTATPKVVEPRTVGLRYSVEHWDGRFVILTNADDAIDFKLVEAPVATPGRAHWKDFVAHKPGHFITGLSAYKNHLLRVERVNANTRIVITDRATKAEKPIVIDEEAYVLGLEGGYEFDTPVMRYVYQSPTTPRQWFDYDMATGEKTLRKTQEIPSGHDPAAYVTRRLYAKAPDGAEVPITVLMKKGVALDGAAPLLLYGYGSYGMSMDPSFSIRNLSLVDRGWIWATAHIRGGSEKGYGWFLDGRKFKKTNTFTDFIACAEHLHAAGYGAKGRTVAYGGSAGGMLMGAVTNLRPDLWAGIIGAVPFVDVLNTMSDTSLPLTPPEWPEWGNPLEDKEAYDYIASYSPYDNVAAKAYPAVLATGGLSDPRVTYWEPEKWTAKLRENTTSGAPILLKINMDAGHGGASGRFDFLKEIALDYAFAVWAVDKGWSKA
ncbi:S9 family peptidase [Caulobacter sp. BE254]|uniref:S9 family peptidase n=1 Tax=Caulobacter sp. BE254 TaxID=2817720 RepID=UPI00285EFD6F|nr:S9 family peptidase [Caulobacter sp. BE254]MDR7118236.1 oligopeptidase B [Caulobacter sp. BE254]